VATLWKTHQQARSFVPVGDCDRLALSIRVATSQLCWFVVLIIVICFLCLSSLGQTSASAKMQVGHDSWTFQQGAPADVVCLAQTKDGFLWLGGPNGLFHQKSIEAQEAPRASRQRRIVDEKASSPA